METKAQAFIFNFNKHDDSCMIGAAVIMRDDVMAVGGCLGVIPGPAADKLFKAARDAGVRVTTVIDDPDTHIVALTWGDIDVILYWDMIAQGIALSVTKAFLQEGQEAGLIDPTWTVDLADDLLN